MKVNRGNTAKGWDWVDYVDEPSVLSIETHTDLEQQAAAIVGWKAKIGSEGFSGQNVSDLINFFATLEETYGGRTVIFFTPMLDTTYEFIKSFCDESFDVDGRGIGVCRLGKVELRDPKFLFEDWKKIKPSKDKIERLVGFAEWAFDCVFEKNFAPLTTQQVIRHRIKSRMSSSDKLYVYSLLPKYEENYHNAMDHLFIGPYSDALELEEINEPVGHVDFKTSYGARLLLDYFPVTPFKKEAIENLEESLRTKCCKVHCTLYDVQASSIRFISKKRAVSYEVEDEKEDIDKLGKIKKAKKLELLLTELDFDLLKKFYKFSSIEINKLWVADRGPLPDFVTDTVAECFEAKEMADRHSVERSWAKALTEMCYGACVKAVYRKDGETFNDVKEKKMYLSPYWGIWCISHARYALLTTAMLLGNDFIYAHTDSLYFTNPLFHVQVIEQYNENQENKIFRWCATHNRDFEIFKNLGKFCYEDDSTAQTPTIVRFLAAGTNRYVYTVEQNGVREVVVKAAGYTQQWRKGDKLVNIWEYAFDDEDELYASFNDHVKLVDLQRKVVPKKGQCTLIYKGKKYVSPTYALVYYSKTNCSFVDKLVMAEEAQKLLDGKREESGKEKRVHLI